MNKNFKNVSKRLNRIIVNPAETLESNKDIIKYAMNSISAINTGDRIITSIGLQIDYDEPADSNDTFDQNDPNPPSLLVWDCNKNLTDHYDIGIRAQLVNYMEIISQRGMLNKDQYVRFSATLTGIYKYLTGYREDTTDNIDTILRNLNLGFYLKYYPATLACPDDFFKLVKIESIPTLDTTNSTRDKLVQFMKTWFGKGNGKIYDQERNEFYAEFMTIYESAIDDAEQGEEPGVITVTRRSRNRKVMNTGKMFNYVEINEILKKYGIPYQIKYTQDVIDSKRRNGLVLKSEP